MWGLALVFLVLVRSTSDVYFVVDASGFRPDVGLFVSSTLRSAMIRLRSGLSRALGAGALLALAGAPTAAQSLSGSSASLDIQNRIAREHDFTYIETGSQVLRFVDAGYLVEVRPNRDFDLHAVSYPYARPEAELFIRRLAEQYRAACGEKMVVTSLTRPQNRQPRNASDRSVHPTGMAIDLRLPRNRTCRTWLEDVLVSLEASRVLEATRERYPAHYHIALFPRQYVSHVRRLTKAEPELRRPVVRTASRATTEYRVRRGDSLWDIARAFETSVERIQADNDLRGNRIYAGQVLKVSAQPGQQR
jgi:LysM repeat protein